MGSFVVGEERGSCSCYLGLVAVDEDEFGAFLAGDADIYLRCSEGGGVDAR